MALIGVRRALIRPKKAASGGLDPATTAWVAAVVSAGGTVSGGQQTNVNSLIVSLKGHGLWSNGDRLWLYASESAVQAKIDLINLASHAVSGTPPFAASQGYTGNGTDFINTNFVPPTNGVNYTQNSASAGVYIRNNRTVSGATCALGTQNINQTTIQPNAFGGLNAGAINDGNGAGFGTATGTSQGFYVVTRTAVNARAMYNKGALLGGDTTGSQTVAAFPAIYALALNNNGTTVQQSSDQIAVVWLGGSLSATDNTNLSSDINTYMTSLGTNVYP
jgi:hypothetical protein